MAWAVEEYDPRSLSNEEVIRLHSCVEALRREAHPDDPSEDLDTFRAALLMETRFWTQRRFRCHHRDRVVAIGDLTRRTEGPNRGITWTNIGVLSEYRQTGAARALLTRIVSVASDRGQSLLSGSTSSAVLAGSAFCRAVGARPVQEHHEHRLSLVDLDRELIADWIRVGKERAQGYSLVVIDRPTPKELIGEVASVMELFNTIPRGDSAMEDERWNADDVEEMDRLEQQSPAMWRELYARHHRTGKLIGYTGISWEPSTSRLIQQGGTMVHPDHRGVGIGKWLKAAMIDWVISALPHAEEIVTASADSNTPMVQINRRLGFRPGFSRTQWEISVEAARQYLSRNR